MAGSKQSGRCKTEIQMQKRIVELEKANQALQAEIFECKKNEESLAFQAQLLSKTREAVYSTDTKYVINYWNEVAEKLFGWTKEEALGKESRELLKTKIEGTSRDQEIPKLWEEGYWEGEVQYLCKNGTYFLVDVKATVLKDTNGKEAGIVTVARDITDRKRDEEKLRESEQRLKSILTGMTDAYYFYDRDWRFIDINQRALEYFGKSREELIGQSVWELYPHTIGGKTWTEYQRAVSESVPVHFETESGVNTCLFEVHAYPDPKGLAVYLRDITERKRAEKALQEIEASHKVAKAIEVERQRLFNVLDALPAMVCLLTLDHKYAFVNRKFHEKFGELNGRHCYEYCFGLTEPCDFCQAYKVLETGKPHYWEITTPDGSIIDVHNFPFTDVDGSQLILEMDIDITDRKKAEEALEKIEKARIKEIHHRIKNNLQVISSLLDLQADKFNSKEHVDCSEVLKAFKESQSRVMSIALIHEELHEGKSIDKLNFSIYLQRLIDNLFQTYKLENANISLNLDIEENIFFDMDTAIPLGMIVNEIISNSLKYAFSGRNKGEIQIKLHWKEDAKDGNPEYVLDISDNGTGIPENINFENPETLGLQLVNILVDQIDGKIKLKRDHGTEFTILFNNQ